ncbi:MAG: hypothetical protein ACI9MR_004543 [Myxococcota bacterium]|jgi:hypothetical protein
MAGGHIVVACVLAFVAPLWLLLLGPLLLGVPHVVSDLRYLVVRPVAAVPRAALLAIGAGLAAMTVCRVAAMAGLSVDLRAELACGAFATFAAVALSSPAGRLKTAALGGVILVGWLALENPAQTILIVAYGHNVIAFGLWLWLARKIGPPRHLVPAVSLYLAATLLILGGAADALVPAVFLSDVGGLTLGQMTETLAPGFDPIWATRLVTWFAFSQAVHYIIWLRLVPQQQAARSAPPTWRRSARDLRRDLGQGGLMLVVALSVGLPLWALLGSATDVRALYLSVVVFHGWLEIAMFSAIATSGAGSPAGAS